MWPAPAQTLRISALLCVLLDTVSCVQLSTVQASSLQVSSLQVSSLQVVTYPAGGAVTLSCSDETNTTRDLSDITQINWRREDGLRSLYYVSDGTKHDTNFSDPRISLLSAQYPPILQITDARAGDAGNYSCKITMVSSGVIRKSWTLQISDPVRSPLIYIIPSVIGLILIITAGLIYCKFCSKWNGIPNKIRQSSAENNEKEEPVYENAQEDYFLHFNTLYDRTPSVPTTQRPVIPMSER